MKTTPISLLLFLLIFQYSFSQKNAWSAIDKSYSYRIITEKGSENIKDSDVVNIEIYSFRDLVDNIDLEKEKPVSKKVMSLNDITEKIDRKRKVSFKKGSVYLVRLQEGIHGGRFRIEINKNADKNTVENISKYISEKVTHGSILTETIDTPERKNIIKSFIITITDNDHFDVNTLKDKFKDVIINITKVATNRNTTFFKITT
ncbi:hypothetical protein SAMN05421856_10739 [Chryseobacterium taichungense]|uniref:Uncharacterized protein n=1 Tax=Chryseobacterium taichungense TaxID=295069 RepID=A0A1H8BID1_9FLAO|nr:hypothetical protein [Chryseobacterium taichungense]SEM82573.1 hypothetical protein SAMN05421856_10739 [Chryseobacterium taichungense]